MTNVTFFALSAGLAVVLSGCGGVSPSEPETDTISSDTEMTRTGQGVVQPALADLEPCRMFSVDEAGSLTIEAPGEERNILGSRVCEFEARDGLLGVGFNDDQPLEKINLTQFEVREIALGDRHAKLAYEGQGPGSCAVHFGVSDAESVTVDAVSDDVLTETACRMAQEAAPLVEAKIPEE